MGGPFKDDAAPLSLRSMFLFGALPPLDPKDPPRGRRSSIKPSLPVLAMAEVATADLCGRFACAWTWSDDVVGVFDSFAFFLACRPSASLEGDDDRFGMVALLPFY